MGWLQRLLRVETQNRQQGERGKVLGPTERMKKDEAIFLRRLRKNDPLSYDAYMRRRLGIPDPNAKNDPLAQARQVLDTLQEMGFIDDPKGLKRDDSWVKDLIPMLPLLPALLQGFMAPRPATEAASPPAEATQAAALPLPAPSPQLPLPGLAEPLVVSTQEDKVSGQVGILLFQLDHRSPEDLAGWLSSLNVPQVNDLVKTLAGTPDEQLPQFLDAARQMHPQAGPVVNWFFGHWEKTLAIVAELRKASGQAASAGMGL